MSACILIVEDNPVNLKLACRVLEMAGYKVQPATSAEQADAQLQQLEPDLILTDIALPGMDGLAFTRKLKSDDRWKHIPVVVLSAFAMKGDDRKAIEAGCDAYITKPIDTRKFPQQIADLIKPLEKRSKAI